MSSGVRCSINRGPVGLSVDLGEGTPGRLQRESRLSS